MTATAYPEPVYYDHATNVGGANPAKGSAVARAARECRADGTAWTVYFTDVTGTRLYWDGPKQAALGLAKSLAGPGCPDRERVDVRLVDDEGREYDRETVRRLRY